MARLPISSGKYPSLIVCIINLCGSIYSFGMTMLETATNIVVPDQ